MICLLLAAQEFFPWGDRQVEVRPGGGMGRVLLDASWPREVERLEAALGDAPVNRWTVRVFIVRTIDAPWTDREGHEQRAQRTLTDEEVETLRQAVDLYRRSVRVYSGGLLELDLRLDVLDGPVARLEGDANYGYHVWTGIAEELIGPLLGPEELDSVIVFWPTGGVPVPYWGGSAGGAFRGAGFTGECVIGDVVLGDYAEVALHEWLHQAEWARSTRAGYTGLPDLHMGEETGYIHGHLRRGWMTWYVDFMSAYFPPACWRSFRMQHETPGRPRPRFDGGFVTEWRVSAPAANVECGAWAGAGPVEPGDDWREARGDPSLDFRAIVDPDENALVYAHVYVRSPRGGEYLAWIGSDDGVKLWVNGELVHERHEHRPVVPDQDRATVRLAVGWNRVLAAVDQGGGEWGLALRFSRPDGTAADLGFSAARPAGRVVISSAPRIVIPQRWEDVRDDPFHELPLLGGDEIGAILRDRTWRVVGGDHYVALQHGDEPLPAVPDSQLNGLLDFYQGGFAYVRGAATDVALVRCDLMDMFQDLAVDLDRGRLRPAAWRVFGWITVSGRPAFVCTGRLATPPRNELELVAVRRGAVLLQARVEREAMTVRAWNDGPARVTLRPVGRAEGERAVSVAPGGTARMRWTPHSCAEGSSLYRARVEVDGGEVTVLAVP